MALTQEDRVVERVTLKAATFGQDITNPGAAGTSKPKVKDDKSLRSTSWRFLPPT
jgi:hypothetical protein